MKANYHTHTWRCNHAQGTEEEYVREALDKGLEILGFSDHTPYCFPGDYDSHFRMRPEQLGDYVSTVLSLRERYGNQIEIHLGVEMEYYPRFFREQVEILKDHPIAYMLLGQHFLGDEMGEPYCGRPTAEEAMLAGYCDQVCQGMNTGLFTYLAHPDLLHFVGDEKIYNRHMRRLCREAKSCGMALELNLLGVKENRQYPNPRFWALAAEEGCRVILGSDAHKPWLIRDPEAEEKALGIVAEYGLDLADTVALVPIV